MEGLVVLGLLAATLPFVLPIIAIVRAGRGAQSVRRLKTELQDLCLERDVTRRRVASLEKDVTNLRQELREIASLRENVLPPPAEREQPPVAPAVVRGEPEPSTSTAPILATPVQPTEQIAAAQLAKEEAGQPLGLSPSEIPVETPPVPDQHDVPPAPPAPPAGPVIEWERWLGVRGAAVLGSVVLALAGLLFFKYSIEHGLVSPTLRVALGTLVGIGCLLGSEKLRSKYSITSNALAGGGAVVLYAAFWAAKVLYNLIGMEVAFGLMALTTATCCLLAVRRNSLLIALLGLAGGFATPLLLASGSDRPIGLFGYILLS